MLALWILLGLFALIGLLLALPLRITLRYTPEAGFAYRVQYAFLSLADSEKAEKKPKKEPKKKPEKKQKKEVRAEDRRSSGAAKTLLNLLGLGDFAGKDDVKRAIREKGLLETLRGASEALFSLLRRLLGLLAKGVFRRFTLRVTVGGDDPAETALRYGSVCAALYPLLSLLEERMRFRRRKVDVLCDYDAEETAVFFDGQICYRPWHVLHLFCGLLLNAWKTKRGVVHE